MKIIDRKTFLAMPAETLYAKYEPCIFHGMMIKGDTIIGFDGEPIDWFYQQLVDALKSSDCGEWGALLDESQSTGKSIPMNFEMQSRDGCFEDDQLFAVFEPQDVHALITRLQRCIAQ